MEGAARMWSAPDCLENVLGLNATFSWLQLTSLVSLLLYTSGYAGLRNNKAATEQEAGKEMTLGACFYFTLYWALASAFCACQ